MLFWGGYAILENLSNHLVLTRANQARDFYCLLACSNFQFTNCVENKVESDRLNEHATMIGKQDFHYPKTTRNNKRSFK
jgi:hypothetical protein